MVGVCSVLTFYLLVYVVPLTCKFLICEKEQYGSDGKEYACNVGDQGSIPGLGRSPRDSGLENSMDCMVHGVAKSWT